MKSGNDFIKIINSEGLHHASSRKLPLLTVSCIFFGYNQELEKLVGYKYGTILGLGAGDNVYFFMNENRVGNAFKINMSPKKVDNLFPKLTTEFSKQRRILENLSIRKPFKTLQIILNLYPKVLAHIGFYNSVMRYIKNNKKRAETWSHIIKFISKDRDIIANLIYGVIEPLLKKCCLSIGQQYEYDGDLLRYTVIDELRSYLFNNKKIIKKSLANLKQRRIGYLYLYNRGKSYIVTDKLFIDKVYSEFIVIKKKTTTISGVSAFPGKVIGRVYKAFHRLQKTQAGDILVINITNPQDTLFLKKFKAIVTNEGGLLSHAAIISRELKIPCVIGTKIATQIFKNGDLVEVDANKGTIRKIKKSRR